MIKLIPIKNDDKKIFHEIASNKKIKNKHCALCGEDKSACDTCCYGNRGKMFDIEAFVFKRYDLYLNYKNCLEKINQENVIDEETELLIRDSYKSSKVFASVKKRIQDNLPVAVKGKCPFCMISEPNTLEHYFPEAKYPEYIIFSPNLVPCCSQCNTNKGDIVTINGERQFLHFYFDEIPTEQYLYADIDMQDGIPVITFTIRLDESKMINRIIKNHYHRLKLIERYMVQCNSLISTLRSEFSFMLQSGQEADACINIVVCKINALRSTRGNNDWEACLLEACIKNRETFEQIVYSTI